MIMIVAWLMTIFYAPSLILELYKIKHFRKMKLSEQLNGILLIFKVHACLYPLGLDISIRELRPDDVLQDGASKEQAAEEPAAEGVKQQEEQGS